MSGPGLVERDMRKRKEHEVEDEGQTGVGRERAYGAAA